MLKRERKRAKRWGGKKRQEESIGSWRSGKICRKERQNQSWGAGSGERRIQGKERGGDFTGDGGSTSWNKMKLRKNKRSQKSVNSKNWKEEEGERKEGALRIRDVTERGGTEKLQKDEKLKLSSEWSKLWLDIKTGGFLSLNWEQHIKVLRVCWYMKWAPRTTFPPWILNIVEYCVLYNFRFLPALWFYQLLRLKWQSCLVKGQLQRRICYRTKWIFAQTVGHTLWTQPTVLKFIWPTWHTWICKAQ